MVRSALVLLTAIAVLWHATAGCCAHHDHAASTAPATESASCGCPAHDCGEEQAARSHASERSKHAEASDGRAYLGSPHDPFHDGCGEHCSFPQPDESGASLLKHSLAACDLTLPVATLVASWSVSQPEPRRAFDAPPPSHVGHALRRHLALGVLLV